MHGDKFPDLELRYDSGNLSIENVLELPAYEFEDMQLRIRDTVWGTCEIGNEPYDELLLRLARTPLFRRLQAVEQLTLPPDLSVIPNTANFSRWQHLWGSLVFVRKMTKGDNRFDDRQKIVLQLRTLLSDVGQTAFSHLGDWVTQGVNSGDNQHDLELRDLLEATGVGAIIEEYGISLDEVVFPDCGPDWVECPSPDLCVDRLDYGLREILRWVHPSIDFSEYRDALTNPQDLFTIDDSGMLQVKDITFAYKLSAAFNILNSEDWGHPVQRLQTDILQLAVKRALLDGHMSDGVALDTPVHPRDRLYGIDSDFRFAFYDSVGGTVHHIMQDIGLEQRRAFITTRRDELDKIFGPLNNGEYTFPTFPDLTLRPVGAVELHALANDIAPQLSVANNGLRMAIPIKKRRFIDPLVNGSRLSSINPTFMRYLHEQKRVIERAYMAELPIGADLAGTITAMAHNVERRWPFAMSTPRSTRNLIEIIGQAGLYGAGNRFDSITEI